MQVVIARSSEVGCEPNCREWIAAQGEIDSTTPAKFRTIFDKLGKRRLPILIDSRGGTVDESLFIGRLVRAKGFDVVVSKTNFKACAPKDDACRKLVAQDIRSGEPKAALSVCASACAFILAAGKRRFVGPGTFVGVHRVVSYRTTVKIMKKYRIETQHILGFPVSTKKTLLSEEKVGETTAKTKTTDADYDKMRRYFVEMGISDSIMGLLMSAPHKSIHVLTSAELVSTHMATDLANGELLLGASQSIAVPVQADAPGK